MQEIVKTTTDYYKDKVRRAVYVKQGEEIRQYAIVLPLNSTEAEIESATELMLKNSLNADAQ